MKMRTTHAQWSTPANGPACRRAVRRTAVITLAILASLSAAAAAADGVTIEKAWFRLITKEQPAAGYFTLHNGAPGPVTLTAASSSNCSAIMLHQSKVVSGVAKMLPVKSVVVPAHGSASFSPGAYHLMCMSPDGLTVGGHIPVTLKFADGKTVTAQFIVQGVNAGSNPK